MGFNFGLAMAIGKMAHGVRKGVQGHMSSKSAGSALATDPTQTAMVNLMHRQRRAMQVGGTSVASDALNRDTKNLMRRSILGGKRDLSDYSKFRAENVAAIESGTVNERMGLLKHLNEETRMQADRRMDSVELAGERKRVSGEATKQTASKNMMSQLPALQNLLQTQIDSGAAKNATEGAGQSEKNKKFAGGLFKTILGGGKSASNAASKAASSGGNAASAAGDAASAAGDAATTVGDAGDAIGAVAQ